MTTNDEADRGLGPDAIRRIALAVTALVFGGFGVFFLVWPNEMAHQVRLQLDGPMAVTEIRAFYGGLQIGLATFFLVCVVSRRWLVAGLTAGGLAFAGLAAGRIFGIVVDQPEDPIVWLLTAAEIVGALFVFGILWMARRRGTSPRKPKPKSKSKPERKPELEPAEGGPSSPKPPPMKVGKAE